MKFKLKHTFSTLIITLLLVFGGVFILFFISILLEAIISISWNSRFVNLIRFLLVTGIPTLIAIYILLKKKQKSGTTYKHSSYIISLGAVILLLLCGYSWQISRYFNYLKKVENSRGIESLFYAPEHGTQVIDTAGVLQWIDSMRYVSDTSDIEVVIIDTQLIQSYIADSDTQWIEINQSNPRYRHHGYKRYSDSSNLLLVKRYPEEIINGVDLTVSSKPVYRGEFYNNGQIMGQLNFNKKGEMDGLVKYFYEDGRIRSIGYFKNGKMTGTWKNYSKEGKLETVKRYNLKGELIKSYEIRNS